MIIQSINHIKNKKDEEKEKRLYQRRREDNKGDNINNFRDRAYRSRKEMIESGKGKTDSGLLNGLSEPDGACAFAESEKCWTFDDLKKDWRKVIYCTNSDHT